MNRKLIKSVLAVSLSTAALLCPAPVWAQPAKPPVRVERQPPPFREAEPAERTEVRDIFAPADKALPEDPYAPGSDAPGKGHRLPCSDKRVLLGEDGHRLDLMHEMQLADGRRIHIRAIAAGRYDIDGAAVYASRIRPADLETEVHSGLYYWYPASGRRRGSPSKALKAAIEAGSPSDYEFVFVYHLGPRSVFVSTARPSGLGQLVQGSNCYAWFPGSAMVGESELKIAIQIMNFHVRHGIRAVLAEFESGDLGAE